MEFFCGIIVPMVNKNNSHDAGCAIQNRKRGKAPSRLTSLPPPVTYCAGLGIRRRARERMLVGISWTDYGAPSELGMLVRVVDLGLRSRCSLQPRLLYGGPSGLGTDVTGLGESTSSPRLRWQLRRERRGAWRRLWEIFAAFCTFLRLFAGVLEIFCFGGAQIDCTGRCYRGAWGRAKTTLGNTL